MNPDWMILGPLLIAPIVDWASVWMLRRFAKRYPDIASLRERLQTAIFIGSGVSIVAFLTVLSLVFQVALPRIVTLTMLIGGIVLPSIANARWLVKALRGSL